MREQERVGPPRPPHSALVAQEINDIKDDIPDAQRPFNGSVLTLCEWLVSPPRLSRESRVPCAGLRLHSRIVDSPCASFEALHPREGLSRGHLEPSCVLLESRFVSPPRCFFLPLRDLLLQLDAVRGVGVAPLAVLTSSFRTCLRPFSPFCRRASCVSAVSTTGRTGEVMTFVEHVGGRCKR